MIDATALEDAESLRRVVEIAATELEAGGVVVVPTDTVYGVAAHLGRPDGLDRLFTLKGRDRSKALAVLVADAAQAWSLLCPTAFDRDETEVVGSMMALGWPGALTLVGPRSEHLRAVDIGGDASTIGVRVPRSPVVRAIADRVGPIATTSANRSGDPTPTDATTAAHGLGPEVAVVIDGGPGGTVPSTVVDVTDRPLRVLRTGAWDPVANGFAAHFAPAPAQRPEGRHG